MNQSWALALFGLTQTLGLGLLLDLRARISRLEDRFISRRGGMLALLLVAGLVAGLAGGAAAQWQPGGSLLPHNHSGPLDGGKLSNLTVVGSVTTSSITATAELVSNGPFTVSGASMTFTNLMGLGSQPLATNRPEITSDGANLFLDAASGGSEYFGFNVTPNRYVFLNASVGIGAAAPATKLHVSSGVVTIDGAGAGLNLAGTSNFTQFLSSQAFTTVSAVNFGLALPYGLTSANVSCELNAVQNALNGQMLLTFNGDTATHYTCFGYWQGGSVGSGGVTCTAANTNIALSANLQLAGRSESVALHFLSLASAPYTYPQFTSNVIDTLSNLAAQWGGAQWTVGGSPNYGTITDSAGTMTGLIRCTYNGW